ncbi:winged helix-turn-helix domain-containing protein [Chelativorans sp. AA-79]|uniref:winged helix-turn-helix domain-containing protein n=1 Tax=Chelativorans sp. AA-79 TaxID=3028735 RepID=UPI0023F8F473|nr:winged helix-turn-helix domain-containing protein [Chelativorans sp. AA-79]WEX07563.1 winged helix-turn-helix domain-containing protein [Chelativorans sp. AA-79]
MKPREKFTIKEVRRIALAAQGFADRAPAGPVERRHLSRVLGRTALFQIDSVNVAARAHYMPLFSRLGPYSADLLERAAARKPRALFEYWAHEASLLPVETQPLMRWRMERAREGRGIYGGLARFGREQRDFIEQVHAEVTAHGPLAASDIEGHKGTSGWWQWSEAKRALEWLFWAGLVTTHSRRASFERLYDLPERVLPPVVHGAPTPKPEDAQRRLVEISAKALGVATQSDLRDYFRLSPEDAYPRIGELVEEGTLLPVAVKGWPQKAFMHRDARLPRRVEAQALLAPFDPLIWERSRTERLFDFHYRIEIYTPAHKRVYGYYVYPFLLGESIVARVDLKADRQKGILRVQAAHAEPGAPPETALELWRALNSMAAWLGLERVEVARSGDFAPALAAAGDTALREPEREVPPALPEVDEPAE